MLSHSAACSRSWKKAFKHHANAVANQLQRELELFVASNDQFNFAFCETRVYDYPVSEVWQ